MSPTPFTERVAAGRGPGKLRRPCIMAMQYLGKGRTLVTRSMMAQPDSDYKEEASLKEDLKFYFMNPCEKYRARRQIPWKLGLQILKIVMVTTQLILFGLSNQLVVSFKEENTVAFKHLFLKNYSGVDEDDYSCSVYTQQDVYDSIFFAINQYRQLKNISLGILGYEQDEDDLSGLQICKQQYRKSKMLPSNDTLNIDSTIETDCILLEPKVLAVKETSDLRNSSFFSLEFYRLIEVELSFKLKGIDLQTIHARELPDCYEFENTITFNNRAHSGKMKIFFDTDADIEECKDLNISGSIQKNTQYILVFDGFVIVSCFASLILCTRSIVLALKLQKNLASYDVCSILLGTSTLFVWVGVIRYLGYFQTYNVLILTMQASLPKVLRFCCCAGMIYLGYTFCGWIVLGPYHEKFEDLNTVAECLFSLVNGDDMFATFAQFQRKSALVWLFSRLYLYSFISLFIYMILSLFIALITDSYDTIKKYQQSGFPVTDLHEFLRECGNEEYSIGPQTSMSLCCCRRWNSDDDLMLIN
ncbi:mucolipin-2 isoform X2 [Heteronotia binoei]|uniref:mucolipin-2 isoform X2 n=1 Tax=Heteronotia binoei TaxID=13085 RepID=UPI00292FA656|nr:mucolipin-2 isoform X2 [Heteronotia binoei]